MSDCNCNLAAIERACKSRAGMKPHTYITCFDEVASIGAATDMVVAAMTMRAAALGPPAVDAGKFYKIVHSRKDGSYSSEMNEETGMWETKGKFFVSYLKPTTSAALDGLGPEMGIIITEDNNGQRRIVGDLSLPSSFKIAEQTEGKNGYMVEYMWESDHAPYFYSGTITT